MTIPLSYPRGFQTQIHNRRPGNSGSPCIDPSQPLFFPSSGRSSGVERNLAKVEVAGSNPTARSNGPNDSSAHAILSNVASGTVFTFGAPAQKNCFDHC